MIRALPPGRAYPGRRPMFDSLATLALVLVTLSVVVVDWRLRRKD